MAATVQIIEDGPRNAIIKVTIALANAAVMVVTESTMSGAVAGATTPRKFSINKIQWSLTGAIATLSWDATADVVIADLCVGWGEIDCPEGIPNNAGAGVTGNIQLDNAAGLTTGFILLYINKQ